MGWRGYESTVLCIIVVAYAGPSVENQIARSDDTRFSSSLDLGLARAAY